MTPKEFQKYLDRDGGHCLHCGTTETLVPQHRINRGSGGPHVPSNIITFCAHYNGLIESIGPSADIARAMGWKLRSFMVLDLLVMPVYDAFDQSWFYLDNDYHRTAADPR